MRSIAPVWASKRPIQAPVASQRPCRTTIPFTDGAVAPSERIVLGGIGIGRRGSYDLSCFLPEPDVQFVAICDVQASRRKAVKDMADAKYGNKDCVMYRDMFELLDRQDIDAVLIATGDHWHALASILAAKAGKDIYTEKPFSLTVKEGRAMVDAAAKYGVICQVGTHQRSSKHIQQARDFVQAGKLLDVEVLDHLVIGQGRWVSLKERGLIS